MSTFRARALSTCRWGIFSNGISAHMQHIPHASVATAISWPKKYTSMPVRVYRRGRGRDHRPVISAMAPHKQRYEFSRSCSISCTVWVFVPVPRPSNCMCTLWVFVPVPRPSNSMCTVWVFVPVPRPSNSMCTRKHAHPRVRSFACVGSLHRLSG